MQIERVRVLENAELGHGPLWLGYYATALAPICRELTLCFPDLPAYSSLESVVARLSEEGPVDIQLEPFALPKGSTCLSDREVLDRACAAGVDLSFITFLDLLMLSPARLPASSQALRPALWGAWFMPVDPDRKRSRLLRPALSRRARNDKRRARVQRNPPSWLDGAFFLDPALASRVDGACQKLLLPDPWPTRPQSSQRDAREALGLPLDTTLFLHFGQPGRRKGLFDVIDAWRSLPAGAVLLRAGSHRPGQRRALAKLEEAGRAIVRDGYVPGENVDLYFRASDWILIPYRWHEGSSGVLSAAAAAQRPVIAADYGVVGRRVRGKELGHLYTHASVSSLRDAVLRALEQATASYVPALDRYANAHTVPAFHEAFRAPWRDRAESSEA
jgi:glycosyltransferase involved in cell wall biosynthesis